MRVFALYVCTMPSRTGFEKWLVVIEEITIKNNKLKNLTLSEYQTFVKYLKPVIKHRTLHPIVWKNKSIS